ncbi:polyadenylate-binding 7 [Olea europaea subsp. europaea]|uniref:Polyadenylate-binding protein n=1 Tax=Olea europaea subsp. europaea TaxID=158383 RepID=A0A8S0R523_OLEEU|nr:polyadenylate-binding 7 [Olea europaea subsp. europaea]
MAVSTTATAPLASLYVGDLHQDVTDAHLFDAFSEFKSLASVRVCRDSTTGRSLGYGYVNFISPQDASQAIEGKNHFSLNSKAIRVMLSHRDPGARRSGIGNVYVKNLSDSIDSVKLQEMFQKFGNVLSCKVVTSDDGKSKEYGFVQFESEISANAAIEKLDGSTVGGKKMYAGKFVKKSDRSLPSPEAKYTNLYIKNLDPGVTEEVLKEKFSEYGKIISLIISKDENGESRGFGFVNFENPDDARHAVEAMHGSRLVGSQVIYVARAQKKAEREQMLHYQFDEKRKERVLKYQTSNVYVKNIGDDITDDQLREYFSQWGTITSAKLMRDDKGMSKGFGFVCFSTPEEAIKAVNTFHGSMFHQKPLYVAIAQRKEERQAQLLLKFSQVMRGFAGQSAVIPGRYSSLYYPVPGVSTQFAARPRPGMMYQPFGMRPGWGADGYANYSIPAFNASPFHLRARHVKYMPNGHSREMNDESDAVTSSEGSDTLSSMLAAAPLDQQKQILGEHLFPLVSQHKPDLAAKITGMLLEMDNSELLLLLESPDSLVTKVEEAVQVLKLKVSNQDAIHPNYLSAEVAVS